MRSRASEITKFSKEISARLRHYVYRLIDPRNGQTFYVGKGVGDRIFAHVAGIVDTQTDEETQKISRVREIKNAGLEVIHVVHRHGLDSATAFEVEAALIDATPGLSNLVGGHDSGDRGPMHAWEIKQRFEAKEAEFVHRAIIISINRTATSMSPYDATRYAWRLNGRKAMRAEVVLAAERGIIIAAFVADQWLPSTPENFPGFPESRDRWGFVGHAAPESLARLYVHKRVPDSMRKRGAANPVRYSYS